MNIYVIAFLSLFDGELKQYKIEAMSQLAAMKFVLACEGYSEECTDEDDIYSLVANCDAYIHVTKI